MHLLLRGYLKGSKGDRVNCGAGWYSRDNHQRSRSRSADFLPAGSAVTEPASPAPSGRVPLVLTCPFLRSWRYSSTPAANILSAVGARLMSFKNRHLGSRTCPAIHRCRSRQKEPTDVKFGRSARQRATARNSERAISRQDAKMEVRREELLCLLCALGVFARDLRVTASGSS